jgi:hypothetical protein
MEWICTLAAAMVGLGILLMVVVWQMCKAAARLWEASDEDS